MSALEKMTSEQGRMMIEVKAKITAMKVDVSTFNDHLLEIKELLQELKREEKLLVGGENSVIMRIIGRIIWCMIINWKTRGKMKQECRPRGWNYPFLTEWTLKDAYLVRKNYLKSRRLWRS